MKQKPSLESKSAWNKGKHWSNQVRKKISAAQKAFFATEDGEQFRARLRQLNLGKKQSEETKRKRSEAMKAALAKPEIRAKYSHTPWNKGRPLDPEHYAHLVASLRGRKFSDAGRKALSEGKRTAIAARGYAAHLGCKQTPESVAKRKATCDRLKREGKFRYATPNTGPAHHNWGKPAYKGAGNGKGSYANAGHWVRSTWERTVADWFFKNNVPYEYEPQLFDLGKGLRYRPDFYLPKWKLWVEVKGYVTKATEQKFQKFEATGHRLVVISRDEMHELQDLLSLGH